MADMHEDVMMKHTSFHANEKKTNLKKVYQLKLELSEWLLMPGITQ